MFWTTFFLDLAFGLMYWCGGTWTESFEQPLAFAGEPAHFEVPVPRKYSTVITNDGTPVTAVGYDFTPVAPPFTPPVIPPSCVMQPAQFQVACPQPVTYPQPTACPQPVVCSHPVPPPAPPMLTPAMPAPQTCGFVNTVPPVSTGKVYDIQIHFPRGMNGCGLQMSPRMRVAEQCSRSTTKFAMHTSTNKGVNILQASVRGKNEKCVDLELECVCNPVGCKAAPKRFRCCETVTLNNPTKVTLVGNDPEPCCAVVTIHKISQTLPSQPTVAVPPPALPTPRYTTRNAVPEPIPVPLPQPTPIEHPVMPVATYTLTPPQMLPVAAAMPVPMMMPVKKMKTMQMALVREGTTGRIKAHSEEGTTSFVRMKMTRGTMGEVTLSAGKKYVHVTGKSWKAYADRVEMSEDGKFMLKGNVHVTSEKTSVKAENVMIEVREGAIQKITTEKAKN